MSQRLPPLLCIQIAHLLSRKYLFAKLLAILEPQLTPSVVPPAHPIQVDGRAGEIEFYHYDQVVVLVAYTDGSESIGATRQRLQDEAVNTGASYLCSIDDDDLVGSLYVERLLEGCRSDADCVTFLQSRTRDGLLGDGASFSLGYDRYSTATEVTGNQKRRLYLRTPSHLCPIKSSIIRCAGKFLDQDGGEDVNYASRLRPLLKTEYHFDIPLYYYHFISHDKRGNDGRHK